MKKNLKWTQSQELKSVSKVEFQQKLKTQLTIFQVEAEMRLITMTFSILMELKRQSETMRMMKLKI